MNKKVNIREKSDNWWNDRYYNMLIKIKNPIEGLKQEYRTQILYLSKSEYIMKRLSEDPGEETINNIMIIEFDFNHQAFEDILKYLFGEKNLNLSLIIDYFYISNYLEISEFESYFFNILNQRDYFENGKWMGIYKLYLRLRCPSIKLRNEINNYLVNNDLVPIMDINKDELKYFRYEDFDKFIEIWMKKNLDFYPYLSICFKNMISSTKFYYESLSENNEEYKIKIFDFVQKYLNFKSINDFKYISYLEKTFNLDLIDKDQKIMVLNQRNIDLEVENENLRTQLFDIEKKLLEYQLSQKTEKIVEIPVIIPNLYSKDEITFFLSQSMYNSKEFYLENQTIKSLIGAKYCYLIFNYILNQKDLFKIKYKLISGFDKWAFFGIGMREKIKNGVWDTGISPGLYGITQHGYSKFHSPQKKYQTENSYILNKNLSLKNNMILEMIYTPQNGLLINVSDLNNNLISKEEFNLQIQDNETWSPILIFYYESQKVEIIEINFN